MAANGYTQNRYSMEAAERDLPAESKLWRAVIACAWKDAFERSDVSLENSDREDDNKPPRTADQIRGEARRWLCSSIDPWASDRMEVCELADVHEASLVAAAKAMRDNVKDLDARRAKESERRVRREINRRLSNILAHERKGAAPGRVGQYLDQLAEYEARMT